MRPAVSRSVLLAATASVAFAGVAQAQTAPRPAPEGEEASAGGSPKVADPPAEGTDIAMEGAS